VTKKLENQLGRTPTLQELARDMGLSIDSLEKMKAEANPVFVTSLNRHASDTDADKKVLEEVDVFADRKAEDPTRRVQRADVLRLVTRGLDKCDRLIIILYYFENMTMKEIGETLGISESRVSQRHRELITRLQVQLGARRVDIAA
jgi:RNA polymerase sigma factor for flagellar operon FliA